ncbi:MAG: DUF3847 domain-containing protein [Gallionellaceae bacterium]|nr:DUF3847 domain-containing protein [Gallionellaceae bacterium]
MTTPALEKLRAKKAQIEKLIREKQARGKSQERKERTRRLIVFGIVVEALLKSGEIEETEWVEACKKTLSERDFLLATAKPNPASTDAGAIPRFLSGNDSRSGD